MNPRPKLLTRIIMGNSVVGALGLLLSFTVMLGFLSAYMLGAPTADAPFDPASPFFLTGVVASTIIATGVYGWSILIAARAAGSDEHVVKSIKYWALAHVIWFGVGVVLCSAVGVLSAVTGEPPRAGSILFEGLNFALGFAMISNLAILTFIYAAIASRWARNPEVTAFLKRTQWDGTEE